MNSIQPYIDAAWNFAAAHPYIDAWAICFLLGLAWNTYTDFTFKKSFTSEKLKKLDLGTFYKAVGRNPFTFFIYAVIYPIQFLLFVISTPVALTTGKSIWKYSAMKSYYDVHKDSLTREDIKRMMENFRVPDFYERMEEESKEDG